MNFAELAEVIQAQVLAIPAAVRGGVAAGAELIAQDARDRIGEYQDAVGDLPAWAPLSDATQADRVAKGFTADDPLLRSGKLRESIEVREVDEGAEIGVFDPAMTTIAAAMELGYWNARTQTVVPPRSYLRGAATVKGEAAAAEISTRVVAILEETKS